MTIPLKAIGYCEFGEVPCKPCTRIGVTLLEGEEQIFPRDDIFMFKDYIPEEYKRPGRPFILYLSEENLAVLRIPEWYLDFSIWGQGFVCNFPDFAIEWLNQKNGIRVYIEGKMLHCYWYPWGYDVQFCFLLTSIKKKLI